VEDVIARDRPDVVFNCAAYNAVDRAETEKDAAFAVNADAPRNIAVACRRHGASMVHFSTNYVFDGSSAEPYIESDEPSRCRRMAARRRRASGTSWVWAHTCW